MRVAKEFDCVEMKNRIQREILAEEEHTGEEEERRRRRDWLETSDSPLARLWREASKK